MHGHMDQSFLRTLKLMLKQCDEAKPICANCRRRSTTCSYVPGSKDSQQTPPSPHLRTIDQRPLLPLSAVLAPVLTEDQNPPNQLSVPQGISATQLPSLIRQHDVKAAKTDSAYDIFDLELWHQWLTVVCYTFADSLDGLPMWRDNIPKLSFTNSYLAKLILALSALHMARTDTARSEQCSNKSQILQSAAISDLMDALSRNGNPSALWAAACLLAFCSFANGPVEGQYLLYAEDTEPEWLGLLQGVKTILTHNPDAIDQVFPGTKKEELQKRFINPEDLIPGITQAFKELRSSIHAFRAEDNSFDKYVHPMDELYTCFSEVFEHSHSLPGERIGGRDGVRVNSHQIFAWLYRLQHEYLVSLQERRPMALVILAHYLVLMSQLKDAWYLEGWVPHIMGAIKRHMHPAYERWLEWPQSQLGTT